MWPGFCVVGFLSSVSPAIPGYSPVDAALSQWKEDRETMLILILI